MSLSVLTVLTCLKGFETSAPGPKAHVESHRATWGQPGSPLAPGLSVLHPLECPELRSPHWRGGRPSSARDRLRQSLPAIQPFTFEFKCGATSCSKLFQTGVFQHLSTVFNSFPTVFNCFLRLRASQAASLSFETWPGNMGAHVPSRLDVRHTDRRPIVAHPGNQTPPGGQK